MLRLLLASLLLPVRIALRRAAFGAAGGFLLLIGVVFLVAAASLALSVLLGPMLAMLITGLVFVGLGLIVLAISRVRLVPSDALAPPVPPPVASTAKAVSQAELIAAFVEGINAGKAMRRP